MSETVSHGPQAGQQAPGLQAQVLAAAGAGPSRRRGRWVALGVVVVVAAGAVAASRTGVLSPAASPGAGQQGAPPPASATVQRQDLSSVTSVNATLGYAGSYRVSGHGSGTLTWLPAAGQLIRQGQVLYRTDNGDPVVLLYGSVPAWRTLDEGLTGADVSQLNHDLVALGDASGSEISSLGWDSYSWATKAGAEKLQSALGISSPSGGLTEGSAVFEPTALRVTTVTGSLGGPASGPVLAATSDRHVVTIALDASQQSEVKAGNRVSITLPDGAATPGTVSSVGTVATAPSGSGGSGGSGGTATIPVTVTLSNPSAAGSLDQAPVTVDITTATASNALVVPVGALLARSSGGYAVEVLGGGNTRRLVPVTPGVFDDANELVQVTGALTPGEHVVVPAS
jgi:hypothetical protein